MIRTLEKLNVSRERINMTLKPNIKADYSIGPITKVLSRRLITKIFINPM
jgi:hypothetical protein